MLTFFFMTLFTLAKVRAKFNKLSGEAEDLVFRKGELLHVYQKHEMVRFEQFCFCRFHM